MPPTVTQVFTVAFVATLLDEDPEMLEAIVYNDDTLSYGAIISVHTGADEAITALTDKGIGELRDCSSMRGALRCIGTTSSRTSSPNPTSSRASRKKGRGDNRAGTKLLVAGNPVNRVPLVLLPITRLVATGKASGRLTAGAISWP